MGEALACEGQRSYPNYKSQTYKVKSLSVRNILFPIIKVPIIKVKLSAIHTECMLMNDFRNPQQVDLRLGAPYSNLLRCQREFSETAAQWWDIDADNIIVTSGTMGGIEAVRNHCASMPQRKNPILLTVRPGYWRAREAFQYLGFSISDIHTEPNGFDIDIQEVLKQVHEITPDVLYLSLPNNPTGAIFDAKGLIQKLPETVLTVLDMTLPSPDVDTPALMTRLFRTFQERQNLFLVGSTSKSHGTAEYRIGWLVCVNRNNADALRRENRNVVSSLAIREGLTKLVTVPPAITAVRRSFELLKTAEANNRFQIVKPAGGVRSCYVLLKLGCSTESVRAAFVQHNIHVMWGSEMGLSDKYIRVEMLVPENVARLIEVLCSACVLP
jgi:aspartate/methionine/tyrosine aminotransferase